MARRRNTENPGLAKRTDAAKVDGKLGNHLPNGISKIPEEFVKHMEELHRRGTTRETLRAHIMEVLARNGISVDRKILEAHLTAVEKKHKMDNLGKRG